VTSPAVRHPGEFRWETRLLALVTLILTAVGIAECYSSATYLTSWFHEASQQALAAAAGCLIFLLASRLDYHLWRRLAWPLFVVTLAGLGVIGAVALAFRHHTGPAIVNRFVPYLAGAHRLLRVGITVQVSEIARFTLTAWLAAKAADLGPKVRDFRQGFLPLMGILGAVVILVGVEPSVSMAVVLTIIGATVIFTSGARVSHLALVVGIGVVAVAAVLLLDPVRAHRQATFQGSALQCTDGQACESLIGFGNGGITGVGFGKGTQKFGALPEAYSDFLFSVIAEELGLVGVVFVVLCYVVFCWMGFRIARTARDPFGTYLASGLTVAVAITAFMHGAVSTWLMPTTGLTLPFMSVGRVSLLLYLFSAGVIVSIGRQRGRPARQR
jgi:cell division protein FtsW